MKHAGPVALDAIESLLAAARALPALTERKRGIFYRKSSAWLHFHEDAAGVFADLRTPRGWTRLRVSAAAERRTFIAALRRSVT